MEFASIPLALDALHISENSPEYDCNDVTVVKVVHI